MKPIHLSASVIIENHKLLLLWKIKAKHYEFPGGKVEHEEDLESAAIREAQEEIGCTPLIIKYIGHNDFSKENIKFKSHMFLAKLINDEIPQIMEPEAFEEILWLSIKEYKRFKLAPNVKEFCEGYIRNNKRKLSN